MSNAQTYMPNNSPGNIKFMEIGNGCLPESVIGDLMDPVWGATGPSEPDNYQLDATQKMYVDPDLLTPCTSNVDMYDVGFLAEYKPLPSLQSFSDYTSNLEVNNGFDGQYQATAHISAIGSNNNYIQSDYQQQQQQQQPQQHQELQIQSLNHMQQCNNPNSSQMHNNNNINSDNSSSNIALATMPDQSIPSSSCLTVNMLGTDGSVVPVSNVKQANVHIIGGKMYMVTSSSVITSTGSIMLTNILTNRLEEVMPDSIQSIRIYKELCELNDEIVSIEEISALIGSVETESDSQNDKANRESWFESFICNNGNEFVPSQQHQQQQQQQHANNSNDNCNQIVNGNTAQEAMLSQSIYMPLLQNRLQNGPPPAQGLQQPLPPLSTVQIKNELSSSTSAYCNEIAVATGDSGGNAATSTASPPGSETTTDNFIMNSHYMTNQYQQLSSVNGIHSTPLSPDSHCNRNMLGNYGTHTARLTTTPPQTATHPLVTKPKRIRSSHKKSSNGNRSDSHNQKISKMSPNDMPYSANDMRDIIGKEKTVHHCDICNRGFRNKSNIKVHIRTHTGEKPFCCDICSKAFRQKAHLLKHQQMHKRIGRD